MHSCPMHINCSTNAIKDNNTVEQLVFKFYSYKNKGIYMYSY